MNIAFCINSQALIGLGVTLTSLLRNCSCPDKLNIWFLCAGLSNSDKAQINKLLRSEGFSGYPNFIDFDPKADFGSFRSLHGDWTTYGRLLLPELMNEDQVLYLDADLVVEVDVLEVDNFDFGKQALAAVRGGELDKALEKDFYINKLGLSPKLDSFNAGILLMNLNEWRARNLKEQCLKIARQYPMELLSCDQCLLNAVFAGNFSILPLTFNCAWYANKSKPSVSEKMILHFVGSPKPWDPFGILIHNGYHTWAKYLIPDWESRYGGLSLDNFGRAWNIRRSYFRCIRSKLMRKLSFVI